MNMPGGLFGGGGGGPLSWSAFIAYRSASHAEAPPETLEKVAPPPEAAPAAAAAAEEGEEEDEEEAAVEMMRRSEARSNCVMPGRRSDRSRRLPAAGMPSSSSSPPLPMFRSGWLLTLLSVHLLLCCYLAHSEATPMAAASEPPSGRRGENRVINIKVGALLEESDHEQANMFIRTIKMINERKDETIKKLLSIQRRRKGRRRRPNKPKRRQQRTSPDSDNSVGSHDEQRLAGLTSGPEKEAGGAGIVGGPTRRRAAVDWRYNNNNANTSNAGATSMDREAPFVTATADDVEPADDGEPDEGGQEAQDGEQPEDNDDDDGDGDGDGDGEQEKLQVKLEPMIEFIVNRQSAFEADEKVCQLIESGVHALVGPLDGTSVEHVQSICDNMEIPYFELRPYLGSPAGLLPASSSSLPVSPSMALSPIPSSELSSSSSSSSAAAPAKSSASLAIADQAAKLRPSAPTINIGAAAGQQTAATGSGPGSSRTTIVEDLTLNLHPPAHLLTSAYIDLIYAWNWTSFAIVYEEGSSMIKLQDLFRESSGSWTSKWQIKLFQFDSDPSAHLSSSLLAQQQQQQQMFQEAAGSILAPSGESRSNSSHRGEHAVFSQHQRTSGAHKATTTGHHHHHQQQQQRGLTFRDIFWRIKLSGELNILLDVKTENLYEALKQAQQVGCMTERFSYLITSLDLHTLDLEDFKYSRTRITGFSIINVIKSSSQQQQQQQQQPSASSSSGLFPPTSSPSTSTSSSSSGLPASRQATQRSHVGAGVSVGYDDSYDSDDDDDIIDANEPANNTSKPFNSGQAVHHKQQQQEQRFSRRLQIDDKYLERLGVHVSSTAAGADSAWPRFSVSRRTSASDYSHNSNGRSTSRSGAGASGGGPTNGNQARSKPAGYHRLSPSVTLERSGSFMDPPQDAYNRDWFRREMLQSSPASMSLLPSVDRDNEQRLFEFFVEQQENSLSRVKLSTASAILHDSLILLLRALHEFDPTGQLLVGRAARPRETLEQPSEDPMHLEQPIVCSLNSRPWLHGSSLVNYMRQVSFWGLTGRVRFDQRGLRSPLRLDMLGMAPDIGLIKVGEWHSQYDWRAHQRQLQQSSSPPAEGDKLQQQQATAAAGGPATRPYDELSELYELELKRYEQLLASGASVQVPYTKPIWRQSLAQRFGLTMNAGSGGGGGGSASSASSRQQAEAADTGRRLLEQYNGPALLVNDIIFERLYREQQDQVDTLIVTTKLSQPYFMLKETPNKLEGNDQYEGFAVDLVHELSKLINFKYRWREVADKKYGSKEVLANGTVVWNGMIGELLRGQADLAIVDLTITAQREEAVDFTLPFMNTGISILFKKPTTKVTTLFSFLSPFSSDVWAYVLAAYCGISANLFLVGHLSPYEWADPHPCRHSSVVYEDSEDSGQDQDSGAGSAGNSEGSSPAGRRSRGGAGGGGIGSHRTKLLENQFSLLNSFWFTIGSLMQQGSDLTPRSMSTRTIAGIWYFFTLIMISSYTANLAAFLTVEKVVYPIENVRDLSQQTEIKYGCVESGSTCTFFHDSQIDTYKRITETMRRFNTYVRSNDEGQKRVEEGKFAYFMESASIEYIVERNCNLTQIGGLLDSKGYGLATSKKSRLKRPYRTLLSEGILHLQETGMLHVLKNRWWKERRGGGTCTDDGKGGGVTELSLANVGGVFVVLLGGLGISFLVAIAEFMWRARRGGSTRDRICEEMMNDLKFALACKSSTKPISLERQRNRRSKLRSQILRQQSAQSGASTSTNNNKPSSCGGIVMNGEQLNRQQQRQLELELELELELRRQQQATHIVQERQRRLQQQQQQQRQQLKSSNPLYVVGDEITTGELDGNYDIGEDEDEGELYDLNEGNRSTAGANGPAALASHKQRRQTFVNGFLPAVPSAHDQHVTNHKHQHQHHRDQQTQQRQQQAGRGVKECDPVLMHAMLSVLTQAQQQQSSSFNGDFGTSQRAPQSIPPVPLGATAALQEQQQQQQQQLTCPVRFNDAELLMMRRQQQQQQQDSRLNKRRLLFAQRTIDMADDVPQSFGFSTQQKK